MVVNKYYLHAIVSDEHTTAIQRWGMSQHMPRICTNLLTERGLIDHHVYQPFPYPVCFLHWIQCLSSFLYKIWSRGIKACTYHMSKIIKVATIANTPSLKTESIFSFLLSTKTFLIYLQTCKSIYSGKDASKIND